MQDGTNTKAHKLRADRGVIPVGRAEVLGQRLLRSPTQDRKNVSDQKLISHNSRGATIGGGWARKAWSCTTFALLSE